MASKMGLSVHTNDASLGNLHARLLLEHPTRIHYGSDDPVTGEVKLRFDHNAGKSSTSVDLFGPLEVTVTLKGVIRIVGGNSAISDSSPQNDETLVKKTVKLHTGPFRAEPGTEKSFPFSINFPEHADAKHKTSISGYQDADGHWKFRQRLSDTTIEDLPPTLSSREKHAIVKSDMSVRYSMSLSVEMPGIDIRILNPPLEKEVLYDRPRVPAIAATMQSDQTTFFKQQLSVESKSLIAPAETKQSHGLKSIFKSKGPVPKYVFDVTCTGIPKNIFIGQPITFSLSLSTNWDQTPAPASNIPEISLNSCTVSLIAHTHAKNPSSLTSEECHNTEVLKEKSCDVIGLTPTSMRGDVDVGTLSAVPSSFSHGKISREYKLKILLSFEVLGSTMNVVRMLAVTVHPPLMDDLGVGAGEVVNGGGEVEVNEDLPAYESVVGAGAIPAYAERR